MYIHTRCVYASSKTTISTLYGDESFDVWTECRIPSPRAS